MPGIKNNTRAPRPDESLMEYVEASSDDLECPSTEGYVTTKKVKTRTVEGIVEDTEYTWSKAGLRRWLEACPKVLVFIKTEDLNDGVDVKKMRPTPVYIDGYRFDVRKGVPVWVPKPIADIIENMQTPFRTADSQGLDRYLINPDNPNDRGLEYPAAAAAAA